MHKPSVEVGLPAGLFVKVLPHFIVELGHLGEDLVLTPAKSAHTFVRDQVCAIQHARVNFLAFCFLGQSCLFLVKLSFHLLALVLMLSPMLSLMVLCAVID